MLQKSEIQTLFISPARLRIGDRIQGTVYWDETKKGWRYLRSGGGEREVTVGRITADPHGCRGKVHISDDKCYDAIVTLRVTR